MGIILATIFVTDQLLGPETGKEIFPFLHHKLTLNFGYRGLWAEIFITGVLFIVSAFTEKTSPEKLEKQLSIILSMLINLKVYSTGDFNC